MAFVPLRLPRIQQGRPIVDAQGYPATDFVRRLNDTFSAIETAYNGITDALEAAGIAQAAADAANIAAYNANMAAMAAQNAANGVSRDQALINSYITPDSVLTADPVNITIATHVRHYANGVNVTVLGGTAAASSPGDTNYVYYTDVTRTGGAVTYFVSLTPPTQLGDTHVVGAVIIPATGTATGGDGPVRPGGVMP